MPPRTDTLPEAEPMPMTLPDMPIMPGVFKSTARTVISTVEMSPLANCDDCTWAVPASPHTITDAIGHAQDTGHRVLVDTITRSAVEVLS